MSLYNVKVGDKLRLNLFLDGLETNKFVRATAYRANGTQLVGSPVMLTSVGNGYYRNHTALTMPNDPQVNVRYEVFEDVGLTTPSTVYPVASDQFEPLYPTLVVGELLAEVESNELIALVDEC